MLERTLRWRVGDLRITRILEVEVSGMSFLIPDAVAPNLAAIRWLRPPLVTRGGEAVACIQAFVIEAGRRRILVDTAVGPERKAEIPTRIERSTDFLQEMEAAGFPPDAIDTVVLTHLHFDHLGWASRTASGGRVPTFPRARYLLAQPEWQHWSGVKDAGIARLLAEALGPVFEAGQLELVPSDCEVAAGVRLEPTPGHTPGHVSVALSSRGAAGVVTGDVVHHPAQMARPQWWTTFDSDPELARRTRVALLERLAGTQTLVIGSHFPQPTAGYVVRDGPSYRFLFGPGPRPSIVLRSEVRR